MKDIRKYDIDILKLSNKCHQYEFESDDTFFEGFEQDLLKKGHFTTNLELDKTETMLQLHFHIQGAVELICDRTLEPFDHPISVDQQLIMKFGEEDCELTDEIVIIARDTPRINVAQYIFEYISLSLPMKKLHPRLKDEPVTLETEEAVLVYSVGTAPEGSDSGEEQEDTPIDPRWQALQKLKGQ